MMANSSYPPQINLGQGLPAKPQALKDFLASRWSRLGAVIIDAILIALIVFPIQFATGYFGRAVQQEVSALEVFGMSLVGILVMLLLNGFLLVTRGQTIGKAVLGIQIVDANSGALLPFVRVYVLRYLWLTPSSILVVIIPGTMDDFAIA